MERHINYNAILCFQEIVNLSQINVIILFLHVFVRSSLCYSNKKKFDSQTQKMLCWQILEINRTLAAVYSQNLRH